MQVTKDRSLGLLKVTVVDVTARKFLGHLVHHSRVLSLLIVLHAFGATVVRANTETNAAGDIQAQLYPLLDSLTQASASVAQSDRATASTQLSLSLSLAESLLATVQSPDMMAALGSENQSLQTRLSHFQSQLVKAKAVVDSSGATDGAALKAMLNAVASGQHVRQLLPSLPSSDAVLLVSEDGNNSVALHDAGDTVCFHVNILNAQTDPSCGPPTVSVGRVGGDPTDVVFIGTPQFSGALDFCQTLGPDAGLLQVTVSTCNQTNSVLLYNYGVPSDSSGSLAAPENLNTPSSSFNTIQLTWTYRGRDVAGFKIERSVTSSGPWTPVGVTNSATTFADTGLSGSTVYYYRVRAFNKKKYSTYSNNADVKTKPKTDTTPPSVPGGFNAMAVSSNRVNVSWNASSDTGGSGMGGYFIYTNGVEFATTTATSYACTNLTASTQYCFTVAAYDNADNISAPSSLSCVTTLTSIPAAPSGLLATATSDTQINLSWTDNSNNELGFRIETAPAASGPWTEIGTVGVNATTFSQMGLNPSGSYYFRVRAYNNLGNSAYSGVVTATTLTAPDTTAPSIPSGLSATAISSNQVSVSWVGSTDTGGSGLAGYQVFQNGTQVATVTAGSYIATGLSPNTAYCFAISAFDGAGNISAPSGQSCATTMDVVPAAPSNLAASTVSATQNWITWQDNSSNETGFMVQRASSPSGPWTQIGTVGANVTSCSHTGLTASTTYYYRVCAFNATGNSAFSSVASATTAAAPDTTPPSVPSGIVVTATSTSQVSVSWGVSTDNTGGSGLAGYQVFRSGTLLATTTATSYSDNGLSAGTSYCYEIVAYDNAGNYSTQSSDVCATTPADSSSAPAAPSNLAAVAVTSTYITLDWQDNSNNEAGFQIQRATSASGPWSVVGSVGANVTTFTDTTVDPSTTYYYQVGAFN